MNNDGCRAAVVEGKRGANIWPKGCRTRYNVDKFGMISPRLHQAYLQPKNGNKKRKRAQHKKTNKKKTAPKKKTSKKKASPKKKTNKKKVSLKKKTNRKNAAPKRTKRHRKVLRDNIQGITKPAIRRLARRGGVKRIPGIVYEADIVDKELQLAPDRHDPWLVDPDWLVMDMPDDVPNFNDPPRKKFYLGETGRKARVENNLWKHIDLGWQFDGKEPIKGVEGLHQYGPLLSTAQELKRHKTWAKLQAERRKSQKKKSIKKKKAKRRIKPMMIAN